MKITTLILTIGIGVALSGCSTDEPLFANDATKAKASNSNPDGNSDVMRDVTNNQHSGASQGANYPHSLNNGALQQNNPYSH